MTPERWRRIKEIAFGAMDLPVAERTAYIRSECSGDLELQRSVERMMREDSGASNTLERAVGAAAIDLNAGSSTAESLVGRTVSHYRIFEKIGEGGMGVVYKAEDENLHRPVALKFLRADAIDDRQSRGRFSKEAEAAAALDHPNITTIYEIGEADGQTFIAMALIEGESLAAKIKQRPLPLDEALGIAIQVAEALQAAHQRGIVHRDIKPSNIMITPEGRVKVMDFGLAHLAGQTRITRTGTIMGTPAYMSPEQARGEAADHRSDIWSLGVVLYEMVTGQLPFRGDGDHAVLRAILDDQPEPMTAIRVGTPPELDRIVAKILAKKPDERYQHAEDLLVDLRTTRNERAAGKTSVVSPATPAGSEGGRTKGVRSRLAWPTAALLGLVVVLSIVLAWTQLVRPTESTARRAVRRFTIVPEAAGPGIYSSAARLSFPAAAAISPDGSRIAYFSSENPPRLWVHDLSAAKTTLIDGTESAIYRGRLLNLVGSSIFWSPDGGSVCFFTESALKKLNLRDGSITILHSRGGSDTSYRGGTWSADGETIVFGEGTSGGCRLFAVSKSGRDVKPLPGVTRIMENPAFVPSEEPALIFQSHNSLHLLRVASGETALLIENGRNASWSPTGHVIFDRDGSVWAVPFSVGSLEPTGEAFLLESDFVNGGVSNDGTLLSVTSQITSSRFQLQLRNRKGEILGEIGPLLVDALNPSISPDGTMVAVSGARQAGVRRDIWVFEVDGRGSLRLTPDPRRDNSPTWTRDGMRILFSSNRDTHDWDLFIVDAAGGGRIETFLDTDHQIAEAAFSPDGRTVIFQERRLDGTQFDIRFVEVPKSGVQGEPVSFLESQFNESHAQFSPDGKHVAYASGESGTKQVHVRPFPAGSPVWQVSLDGGVAPRWSPDGRELYWWSLADSFPLMSAKLDFARSNPVGEREILFPTGRSAYTFLYDVMPDGRFVILHPVAEDDSETSPPIHIRVTENWYEEFRDRQ